MKDSVEPLVSIIVPVYNGEQYIPSILRNLKNLSYHNYEVIFINDGSTDKTKNLLLKAMKADSRIRVINQDNAGVSAARNCGIDNAIGEYICFVDVDDEIVEEYLTVFLHYMIEKKVHVSFCDTSHIKKNLNTCELNVEVYSQEEILKAFLLRKVTTGMCSMMISRKILEEHQLRFKEGYHYSEDIHMVWRVFDSADKVVYIKSPLYIYKENPGSAMTKMSSTRLDSIKLMKDLEGYFERNNQGFYPYFHKYGVARIAWSLLWQCAHYMKYNEFERFLDLYDFSTECRKLIRFPDPKVSFSAFLFLCSSRLYYHAVQLTTLKYRR